MCLFQQFLIHTVCESDVCNMAAMLANVPVCTYANGVTTNIELALKTAILYIPVRVPVCECSKIALQVPVLLTLPFIKSQSNPIQCVLMVTGSLCLHRNSITFTCKLVDFQFQYWH